jgi:hypothetical protein
MARIWTKKREKTRCTNRKTQVRRVPVAENENEREKERREYRLTMAAKSR